MREQSLKAGGRPGCEPHQADFVRYWYRKHSLRTYVHKPPSPAFVKLLRASFAECSGFVLDHGCGSGRLSLALAKMGIPVALNDIIPLALVQAEKRLHETGLRELIAWRHLGGIETWDGPTPWGGVLSHRVLHCAPRLARKDALRMLSQGLEHLGTAVITVRSTKCTRLAQIQQDDAFSELEDDPGSFLRRDPFRFLHFYSRDELAEDLGDCGLTPDSVQAFTEQTGNQERDASTSVNRYWLAVCRKLISTA